MKHGQHSKHRWLLVLLAIVVIGGGGGAYAWHTRSSPTTQQTVKKAATKSTPKEVPSSTTSSSTKSTLPAKGTTIQYFELFDNPDYASIAKRVKVSFSLSEPVEGDADSHIDMNVDNTSGYPIEFDMNALQIDTIAGGNMRFFANSTGGILYPSDKNYTYTTTNVISAQGDVFDPDRFPAIIRYFDRERNVYTPIAVNWRINSGNGAQTKNVQADGYAMMHHFSSVVYPPELAWSPASTVKKIKANQSLWEYYHRFEEYPPTENAKIGGYTKNG